ncbi:MAG: hypothetical protein KF730_17340 [Sphingomonas sp.]|uniref:hypothetical protein n=1 Tax=Sphingomonas sp. TaxID=28214 RepID=UPI0025D6829D|nr:hypothetical protein [Sphingomonas sp.]MBX3566327.1 hypothetical protein [Sphingomonas sp.]
MRFVDRTKQPAPASLAGPSAGVTDERKAAAAHYGNPPALAAGVPAPKVRPFYNKFNVYKNYDVGVALGALFKGKCAYCESEVGAPNDEEIEHYRPKGGVTEAKDHNGYWWLASQWDNLLLSCTGCNQGRKQHLATAEMDEASYLKLIAVKPKTLVGKRVQFPVDGVRAQHADDDITLEIPHLIDPTVRDPKPSLRWLTATDLSVLTPVRTDGIDDKFGAATIRICALNRGKLVVARTTLLRQLRVYRTKIFEQLESDDSPGGVANALVIVELLRGFAVRGKPYSAMAGAFVGEVVKELETWLAKRDAAGG